MDYEIIVKTHDGEIFKFNSIALAIKKARETSGLSQKQVATKLGINVANWQKYEYGMRFPKESMLEKIAIVLGVDISELTNYKGI